MSYPRTYEDAVASSDRRLMPADWNAVVASTANARNYNYNYIIKYDGTDYSAYDSTGVLAFGGATDEGGADGADEAAVQQAAINALTSGFIYIQNSDLAAGVTLEDGIMIVEEHDGTLYYKFSNPDTEVPATTNANVQVMYGIKSTPTNTPAAEGWSAFSSEIIGAAGFGAGKALVAGYFGAKAIAGEDVWALNPLTILTATSTGNSIVLEADLANQQADGVGIGVASYLGEADGAAAGDHKDGLYAFHAKDNCTVAGIGWQYGLVIEEPLTYGAYIDGDPSTALYGGDVDAGGNADFLAFKSFTNPSFWVTSDPIIKIRKYTPEGAPAVGNVLEGYLSSEVNNRVQLTHSGLYFGAGGASAIDAGIYRYAANQMALAQDDQLLGIGSVAGSLLLGTIVTGDTQFRVVMQADGAIYWGPGNAAQDAVLYRAAANQLRTTDQLVADDGLVTKYVAHNVTDADTLVDTDGCLLLDTSGERFYARWGGNWHYIVFDHKTADGTTGATANVDVAKVGGGTRTLQFKNGLYVGFADS